MAASRETVSEILRVVRKHVGEEKMAVIMRDLMDVRGNKSFRETVQRVVAELMHQT